jgi:hypothetical protein
MPACCGPVRMCALVMHACMLWPCAILAWFTVLHPAAESRAQLVWRTLLAASPFSKLEQREQVVMAVVCQRGIGLLASYAP